MIGLGQIWYKCRQIENTYISTLTNYKNEISQFKT